MTERHSIGPWSLADFPAHLGRNATVAVEPRFDGDGWFEAYGERHTADTEGSVTAVFITAGVGTEHRER